MAMGGSSSSGKGSTTSTTQPNPQAANSYSEWMSAANKLARQPYQAYGGQLVAGFTPTQETGFGQLESAYGSQLPYMQMAQKYGELGASPLQASAIQGYMNPYQDQVVNATMRQLENIQQANNAQSMGAGLGAGGLFNDRLGVQQGQLANQEALANAQTLGGLNTQNWNQALAAAQADRAAAAQGAYTFGNLGQENLQAILQGAGATMAAGNQQQQQQQANLNSLYNQWNIAKAYPYQQIAWAAGIDTGLGSQGGTSTTTPPAPNPLSQYGGLGLAAAGLGYNMYKGNSAFSARGGRVEGMADGGVPGSDDSGGMPSVPWGNVKSYIPPVQITKGSGPPKPPNVPQQQPAGGMPKGLGGLGGGGAGGGDGGFLGPLEGGTVGAEEAGAAGADAAAAGTAGDFIETMGPMLLAGLARGGRAEGGIYLPHGYQSGGNPVQPDDVDSSFDPSTYEGVRPTLSNMPPLDEPWATGDVPAGLGERSAGSSAGPSWASTVGAGDVEPVHYPSGLGPGAGKPLAPRGLGAPNLGADEENEPAGPAGRSGGLDFASLGNARAQADQPRQPSNAFGNALMSAGFALMGNRSPYLGQAIGEAGLAGLGAYAGTQKTEEATREKQAKQTLEESKVSAQLQRLAEASKQAKEAARLRALTPHVLGEDSYGNKTYGVFDPDKGGWVNPITGKTVGKEETPDIASIPSSAAPVSGGFEAAVAALPPELRGPDVPRNEEALEAMPAQIRDTVKGLVNYQVNPASLSIKGGHREQLINAAMQYDPTYDQSLFPAKQRAMIEFYAGGPQSPAGVMTAGNTAILHLGEMSDAMEELKAQPGPMGGIFKSLGESGISYLSLWANARNNEAIRGTPAGAALTKFETARQRFSAEVEKFYAGGQGSQAEREHSLALIDPRLSLPELRAGIAQDARLMSDKVAQMRNRLIQGMGPSAWRNAVVRDPDNVLIYKNSREALSKVQQRETSGVAPIDAAPARTTPAPASAIPERARAQLKEGVPTRFTNGQTWMLRGGQPVQVSPP